MQMGDVLQATARRAPSGAPWLAAGAGAIVIGSDYSALGIARSLGRHGIPVWVIREGGHVSATVSRHVRRRLSWPEGDEEARVAFLVQLAIDRGLGGWTLYPTGDEAAALIARNEEALAPHYRLTTPHWQAMRHAYDKRLTHALAAELGIDQPWTACPASPEEAEALDCAFPAVLKPAMKDRINAFTLARAWRVEDRTEFRERYGEASALMAPGSILIQELVPGGGESQFSFAAYCEAGRPLAWVTARRTRQYPPDFGHGSSFVETVIATEVEEPSRRLLAAIAYDGLVELEYKRDPRTGRMLLLDFNARSWAWHTLGRRAGADFPWLCWRHLHGEATGDRAGAPGARWVRGMTDVAAAVAEIRAGKLGPLAYLYSLRPPIECAVLALDDPLPAIVDVPSLLLRLRHREDMIGRDGK